MDTTQFVAERNAALLSLDRARIVAYMVKYGNAVPRDQELFWLGVHKARTAIPTLPMAARIESKRWLEARDSQSLDEGDIPATAPGPGGAA